jgi:septum formation protein
VTWQAATPALVLASASPARAAMLREAGLAFTATPAAIDEAAIRDASQAEGHSAEDTALLLAELKASAVARRLPDALVIGADQILVCDNAWFAKPDDRDAARAQLRTLAGRTHRLATAVSCHRHGGTVWHHIASPRLAMRAVSDAWLDTYLAHEGDAVLGSVGAYRVEGAGIQLFTSIDGEHAAVLGLPLLPLLAFLRQHGVLLT